ncbi:hypothetical protein DERP_012122 [Dermatophagoides pteronyssinus]|uniref:Uncharacterized protein n=1 Tax=Dermatophagoides pteronyssinus TaxID=6956 RepID=A0ABQ8IU11_DERPT|nr:hypothetical protein DERP_012122 [Dermatophagoides pteronyssinus]
MEIEMIFGKVMFSYFYFHMIMKKSDSSLFAVVVVVVEIILFVETIKNIYRCTTVHNPSIKLLKFSATMRMIIFVDLNFLFLNVNVKMQFVKKKLYYHG